MAGGLWISWILLYFLQGGYCSRAFDEDFIDSCELSPILVPTVYNLKFDLDFSSRRFKGEEIITGQVLQETKYVLFDSAVNVHSANLQENNELINEVLRINQHNKSLEIEFEKPLQPGRTYNLEIKFDGVIRNVRGLYGRNYTTTNNEESYFMATEFQPDYASHAFPCIDRPTYKAMFLLNVSREANHIALSNMPLDSSLPDASDASKVWDSFKITPKMSTYTFAFVVGDLVSVQSEESLDVVNNTVWAVRGQESMAKLPAKWAPIYMKEMEKYTGILFDLPKLDHVALPFLASTAMEHWGIITYKQEVLLLEEDNYTVRSQFGLIWIMAHEIAHQWFGNLVTCSSWAYTWLNEGITSFLHFLISGKVFPEWNMLELMMSEEVLKVMDDEGFSPVSLTKDNCTVETSDTFSMASYYKGAAILRMVYYIIGAEAVQKGLSSYLNENKYGSVDEEDLWLHFGKYANDKSVLPENTTLETVMQGWSNNLGFPMISMTRQKELIKLEQTRLVFFLPDDAPEQKWWVPLSYTTSSEKNFSKTLPRAWMNPDSQETILDVPVSHDGWIIFNLEQAGYYRVLYDDVTWASISRQLLSNMTVIPPLSRAKLIDDVFTLTFYKKLHYSIPLTLARYLENELHYYPWSAAIRALEHIHYYIKPSEINVPFEKYMLRLVEKAYKSFTLNDNYKDWDNNSKLLYSKILNFACSLGHKECEEKAQSMMAHLLEQDVEYTRRHLDEIIPLMCTMVKLGGQEIWNLAFKMYKAEKVFKPKDELMEALKCTTNQDVLKNFVRKHVEGEKYYRDIDLLTSGIPDTENYCTVIEVIDEVLTESPDKITDLVEPIMGLSDTPMPERCSKLLKRLVEKNVDNIAEPDDILKSIEKAKKSWIRLKEIEEWLDEERNRLDVSSSISIESEDTNLIERSVVYDGMGDDAIDLPPYPHHRAPQDYDYESRHGKSNQVNSAASVLFNCYILIFSVLPSPFYLTYLIFTPFI